MMRMTIACVLGVAIAAHAPIARADLLCPSGSLSGMLPTTVWPVYASRNSDYVKQLLKRLANNLAGVVDARGTTAKLQAAANAGKDNSMVMQRMFEEGFIAATDIMFAHCATIPSQEPWNETIQNMRRAKWCKEWPDAHFCPRRR